MPDQMLFLDTTGALNTALLGTGLSIGAGPALELATTLQQMAAFSTPNRAIVMDGSGALTGESPSAFLAWIDGVSNAALATTLAAYMLIPSGTTSQYIRGDGSLASFPSIPSAQVNSDWSASSGVSQILNKPTLGTAAAQNTSFFATAAQGALADTAVQPAALSDYATTSALTSGLAGKEPTITARI